MVQFDLLHACSPGHTPGDLLFFFSPGGLFPGENQNELLFDFAKSCYFSPSLHEAAELTQDYLFSREFTREWMERNNLSKLKSVFKGMLLANMRMIRTRIDFFFWQQKKRYISSVSFTYKST